MPPEPRTDKRESRPMAVGQVERMLILRTFPGFADLEPELIAVIAEYSRERFFPEGAYLFRENVPITSTHFIVSGRVELRRQGLHLRELDDKSAVGGLAAFSKDPHGYDAIALTDIVSLEMRIEDMIDIFEDHFPILRGVLRGLAREVLKHRRTTSTTAGYDHVIPDDSACPPKPLDLVERMALIRATMTFAKSRLDAVADMAREAREVRISSGEMLWEEADPSDHMIILVSGRVACRTSEGHEFHFGRGDVVGAIDSAAGDPRWYSATVEADLVGLRLEMDTVWDLYEDNFDMAMDLLESMSGAVLWILDKSAGIVWEPTSEPD